MSGKESFFQKIRNLYLTARLCHRIHPFWGKTYFRALKSTIRLRANEGFTPREAFKLGLTQPETSPETLERLMSKKKMMEVQSRLNPGSWINVTEDKGIFYKYAEAWGAPIPRLYALYFRKSSGWAFPNKILTGKNDWIRFLDRETPQEFVIKPSRGVYGKKVRIFIKSGENFADPFGKKYGASDILDLMAKDREYDRFVIQERLVNHPDIIRLTGTPFLQTVRISSFVDAENKCHLLHSSFRMIRGDYVTDNFFGGGSRNLLSEIDAEAGSLRAAISVDKRGAQSSGIRIHPKTGVEIEGFRLPFWEDLRRLILETAPRFLPIRTLGWDVGITSRGLAIIEANMFWDPPNQSRRGRVLLNKWKETKVSIPRDFQR